MLSDDVNRYVAMQRGFGLKFDAPCRILLQFARYAEEHGDRYILTQRVFDWCRIASSPTQASTFFNAIRRLCVFLHAEDTRHELLPVGAFGPSQLPRPTPHLLDSDHVRAIMEAALELSPKDSIRPHTYHHLFGLLAATGLRISEALALKCSDLNEEGLVVRSGKFDKSRLLPIHPTTRLALARYLAIRGRFAADVDDLFVVTTGRSPNKSTVCRVFVQLARELGLRPPSPTRGVRLHDLRHNSEATIIPSVTSIVVDMTRRCSTGRRSDG